MRIKAKKQKYRKEYIKQVVKIQVNDMKVKKNKGWIGWGIKEQKVYFKIVLGLIK